MPRARAQVAAFEEAVRLAVHYKKNPPEDFIDQARSSPLRYRAHPQDTRTLPGWQVMGLIGETESMRVQKDGDEPEGEGIEAAS